MSEEHFIVAFELGSSKITAVAGYRLPDGSIKVLASKQEPSSSFIRKGAVYNVDLMTARLKEIKENMEALLLQRIDKAYVAIGGMGMHTVSNMIVQQFGEEQTIKQELIDEILEINAGNTYTDREILDVVPLEYKLGTILQPNPIGVVAESIEGNFLNIILRSSYRKQIEKCFEAAGIHIIELKSIAQIEAENLLAEDESRSGCVLVDMGAQTTTVAVYKNQILRHLAAIPLGGKNITADISSFNIKEEEAESLKLNYATAISSEQNSKTSPDIIVLNDGRKISKNDFNDCVWSRIEEILLNIDAQIKLSKYKYEELPGGLIITGGAANLNRMAQALQEYIGMEKLRFARTLSFSVKIEENNLFGGNNIINETYNTVLTMIANGEINCSGGAFGDEPEVRKEDTPEKVSELIPEPQKDEEEKPKKKNSWKQRFSSFKEKLNEFVGDE